MFKYVVVVLAVLLGFAFAAPNPAPVASPNPSILPLGLPVPLSPVIVAGPRLLPAPVVIGPHGPVIVG